jgi:hypothetical protein
VITLAIERPHRPSDRSSHESCAEIARALANGEIAAALMANAELLATPAEILAVDVLAGK